MKRQITAKDLNMYLKHGQTTEEFARRYQCTTEEFMANLEKAFKGRTLKDFKRRLADNDEEAARRLNRDNKKDKRAKLNQSAASAKTAQEHGTTNPMEKDDKDRLNEEKEALIENVIPEPEEKAEEQTKATTAEMIATLLNGVRIDI